MKKRLLSLFLALVLVFCMLPSASAEEDELIDCGYWGTAYWEMYSQGHLSISNGVGVRPDFSKGEDYPWAAYREQVTSLYLSAYLKLPEDCSGMFKNYVNITSLDVLTDAPVCADEMFMGCSSITYAFFFDVNFNKLTSARSLFEGCSSLDKLLMDRFCNENHADLTNWLQGTDRLRYIHLGVGFQFTGEAGTCYPMTPTEEFFPDTTGRWISLRDNLSYLPSEMTEPFQQGTYLIVDAAALPYGTAVNITTFPGGTKTLFGGEQGENYYLPHGTRVDFMQVREHNIEDGSYARLWTRNNYELTRNGELWASLENGTNFPVTFSEPGEYVLTGSQRFITEDGCTCPTVPLAGKYCFTCVCPAEHYDDVAEDVWYHYPVDFVAFNGIMTGTADTVFAPDGIVTRPQMVQIIYSLVGGGMDMSAYENPFRDVKKSDWYYNAVLFCYYAGITSGTSETTFGTKDTLTREQVAVLLQKLTLVLDKHWWGGSDLSVFPDCSKVSGWAVGAVKWAVINRLISGREIGGLVCLAPNATCSRAEIATMMMRYCQNFL